MAKNPKTKNKKAKPVISRVAWYSLLIAGILTFVCAMVLILRWSLNAYFVSEAKKGRYHYEMEKMLTTFNIPDGYVIWYNIGNYHYQQGDFEEAEQDYYRAIECGIPYEKECPVKVNLALSMIEQLSDEEWEAFFECDDSEEMNAQARKVEKTLITARTILCEDGCAHENDEEGHYEDAQILKDEIDELLENSSSDEDDEEDDEEDQDDSDSDDNNDDGDEGSNQSSREDQVMEHIQEQKEEAQEERADEQQFYENYYGFGSEGDEEGGGGSSGGNGEIW